MHLSIDCHLIVVFSFRRVLSCMQHAACITAIRRTGREAAPAPSCFSFPSIVGEAPPLTRHATSNLSLAKQVSEVRIAVVSRANAARKSQVSMSAVHPFVQEVVPFQN